MKPRKSIKYAQFKCSRPQRNWIIWLNYLKALFSLTSTASAATMNTDLDLISLIFVCKMLLYYRLLMQYLAHFGSVLFFSHLCECIRRTFSQSSCMFPLLLQVPNWHWKLFGKRWAPTSNAADANEEEGAYVGVGVGVSAYDGRFSFFFLPLFGVVPKEGGKGAWKGGGDRLLERPNPCERSGMGFTIF